MRAEMPEACEKKGRDNTESTENQTERLEPWNVQPGKGFHETSEVFLKPVEGNIAAHTEGSDTIIWSRRQVLIHGWEWNAHDFTLM